MILRKISSAIRRQEWPSLLIEIVVLFIGIFAALQVDGWNRDRIKQEDVSHQLSRINEDARFLRSQIELTIQRQDKRIARFRQAEGILDGEALTEENRGSFEALLYTAMQIYDPSLRFPGLDLLVSSGDITLIRDNRLQSALMQYAYEQGSQELISTHLREILNLHLSDFYRAISYEIVEVTPERAWGAEFGLRYDIQALGENQSFRRALGNIAFAHSDMRGFLVKLRDRLDELIITLNNPGA